MVIDAVWIKVDAAHVGAACEEALAKLSSGGGELVLDFSAVRRLDPAAIQALEKLAAANVTLCGVNVDVYKVLKLAKLAPRFAFR